MTTTTTTTTTTTNPTTTTTSCKPSVLFLVFSTACLFAVFWLGSVTLKKHKDAHKANFITTAFNVTYVAENPFECAVKRSCVCLEAIIPDTGSIAPSCAEMVSKLIPGTCSDGYHCCNKVCEGCEECRGLGIFRSCNWNSCCTKRCLIEVLHERCESYVGHCYRPERKVSFRVRPVDLTGDSMEKYKECTEMKRDNCSNFLIKTGVMQKQCSIDQNTCASSFVNRYPIGTVFVGSFDMRDVTNIYDDDLGPSFSISDRLVTQLFICAVLAFVFLVAAIHFADKTRQAQINESV